MSTVIQSFLRRVLQYAGDQDDLMRYDGNGNTMERVNDTDSLPGIDSTVDSHPLDNLADLTDDNIMSWYDNVTASLLDGSNSTNATSGSVLDNTPGNGVFMSNGNNDSNTFDPRVFWSVNAFIFVLFCVAIFLCCYYGKREWLFYDFEEGRRSSDEAYRQTVLRRRRQREEAKVETPEQRTKKLLKSFALNEVSMVSGIKGRLNGC